MIAVRAIKPPQTIAKQTLIQCPFCQSFSKIDMTIQIEIFVSKNPCFLCGASLYGAERLGFRKLQNETKKSLE